MTEAKTYCDHCGKELHYMTDYIDTVINAKSLFKCDLCNDCINELDEIVLKFCKKGGAE